MDRVMVSAPAKINLFLAVTGFAGNGYHSLFTVMQSVDLCDTVIIEKTPETAIRVACSHPELPRDEGNIAHRAAVALLEAAGISHGLRITIEKHIPSEAGLGGGSADAAAVLLGLDHLLGLGYGLARLCEIGVRIGADVPFCLTGGCALAEGIGERLTPLPPLSGCHIALAKPESGVSTRDAYRSYDEYAASLPQPDGLAMLAALRARSLPQTGAAMYNVFEHVTGVRECGEIKAHLLSRNAVGAALSGSGSAVAGLFPSRDAAAASLAELSGRYWTAIAEPLSTGTRLQGSF